MRAGKLNRIISIRSPSVTSRSTDGEPIFTWTTILDSVWADVQPVSGRELFSMNERWGDITTKFILRYSSLVTIQCRVFDHTDSKEYDIKSVIDIDDERRGLEILGQRTV